jgi:hypothetical protein
MTRRMIALLVVAALLATLATPARADAAVLETIGIISLVVVGVIVIVYLIVANVAGRKASIQSVVACAADDSSCWGALAPALREAPVGALERVEAL